MESNIVEQAHAYRNRLFPGFDSPFSVTDPEFQERFDAFCFGEVPASDNLDDKTRLMAILAALVGCRGIEAFQAMAKGAFNVGVTPVEVKEIVYQAVPYLGLGCALPFLHATNELLEHRLVSLPLEGQATTTMATRAEAGAKKKAELFGADAVGTVASGYADAARIDGWVESHCFGDCYTRTGLDDAQREMVAFCFLAAQGGHDEQLTGHARANMRLGNDAGFLVSVLAQCVPYIGYPLVLDALRCVERAAGTFEDADA